MTDKRLARWAAALALAALALGSVATALAADATSGIPVGGGTPAFQVQDVTGVAKGGTVCYI